MSMVLTSAKIKTEQDNKNELIFCENNNKVLITEYLDGIISSFIEEKIFFEKDDDEIEEVSYKVISLNNIVLLNNKINKESKELIAKLNKTKGKGERDSLISQIDNLNTILVILLDVVCNNSINKDKKEVVIF